MIILKDVTWSIQLTDGLPGTRYLGRHLSMEPLTAFLDLLDRRLERVPKNCVVGVCDPTELANMTMISGDVLRAFSG